jgi:hypothetical protein
MTFTSVPPRRFAVRQQSMAVLPTPMMSTRGSMVVTWPKCTTPATRCRCGCGRCRAAGDVQVLALRRAAADEDGVVALAQQPAHAVDGRVVAQVDAHVEDVVDLLVEHGGRQPERRDVRAHEAAGAAASRRS